jgi:hypothetical protein
VKVGDQQIVFRRTEGRLQVPVAVGIILLLWLGYTVLQTLFLVLQLDETLVSILEFIPGILGVGVLLKAGFSKADLFLRPAWPSWKGLLLLGVFSLVWPFVLSTGRWIGWDWQAALLQGAGGISQELFFRAALLPAFLVLFKYRPLLALLSHVVLFCDLARWCLFNHPTRVARRPNCHCEHEPDRRAGMGLADDARPDCPLGDDPSQPAMGGRIDVLSRTSRLESGVIGESSGKL